MRLLLDQVAHDYPGGHRALFDVSLTLEGSQVVLLGGRNGSGKSTLLRHLNGLLKPTSGMVEVNGIDTRGSDPATLSRYVALSFQNPDDQIFCSTVREEVSVGPKNLKRQDADELANLALDLTALVDSSERHPYDLHPTERRWLSIASALALGTDCLAFDEPTAGMDVRQKLRFRSILERLKERGKLVVVSSHDTNFFMEICDRAVLLSGGLVLYTGTPRELLSMYNARSVFRLAGALVPVLPRLARTIGISDAIYRSEDFLAKLCLQSASAR